MTGLLIGRLSIKSINLETQLLSLVQRALMFGYGTASCEPPVILQPGFYLQHKITMLVGAVEF